MADNFVQIDLDSTGKKVDTESLTVGSEGVHRQRMQIAGAAEAGIAIVTNAAPGASDYGLVVRPVGSVTSSAATTSNAPGITAVALNLASTTLLASNASRLQATFENDADQDLLLKIGTTASTSSFTKRLPSGGYYELPTPVYTGDIDGIWVAAGSGNCLVTEIT